MYTSTVGKTFLKGYNKRFGTIHTPRSFFEEVFIPLFFDHEKYMMTAGNSPLENPKLSWEEMIKGRKPFETPERRKERIEKMLNKIEKEKADASIAIGYGVADETAGTSGQITSMGLEDNKDDIYLSWVGAGLSIGVSGGISLLFEEEELLLDIFEGWKFYREYLLKNPLMKGNQINTWNAHWICHRYGYAFDEDDPTSGLNPLEKMSNDLFNIPTITWVKVLLSVAKKCSNDNLIGYLYNIGQTNTTIGFIPFQLNGISKPNHLYQKIFGKNEWLQNIRQIESLYGTQYGLRVACQMGVIGVKAMEPKGLRAYFPSEKGGKKIPSSNNQEQQITFNTYLIWILAMLNNEQLWDKSQEIANLLLNYESGAGKARKDRTNNVTKLLESSTVKQFLLNMIPIVEDEVKSNNSVEVYEEIGKLIHMMPKDNYPYLNTLIRFQYAMLNK